MPAIVYHIGIFDKRDEPDYVKYVIKSQMTILSKHCKSADIYIGMHADEEQIEMIICGKYPRWSGCKTKSPINMNKVTTYLIYIRKESLDMMMYRGIT